MWWIVGGGWLFALVLALVVLGFCAFELRWKLTRLRTDSELLQARLDQLHGVQVALTAAQHRLTPNLGS